MTTARDVIAKWFSDAEWGDSDVCDLAAESLLSCIEGAPDSVRQELAALLNPWRPMMEQIKDRIDCRLNDCLCEMKPDSDDSITGFNEAWDIVRAIFKEELEKLPLPTPPTEDK